MILIIFFYISTPNPRYNHLTTSLTNLATNHSTAKILYLYFKKSTCWAHQGHSGNESTHLSHIIREEYSTSIISGKTGRLTENWLAMTGDASHKLGMICHCRNSPLNPLDMLPLLCRNKWCSNQYTKKEICLF